MRVGIMSMQRIANYGSFLQAYGLKCMLQELGCDVEFVDYHPGKPLIPVNGGDGYGMTRKLLKVIEIMKSGVPLLEKIRYIEYKKNYAKRYYPYLEIGEGKNYKPKLDLLVIGSDEVFNCVQDNTNVGFSPELFGEGNQAERLITYAASFGNTTVEKLQTYGVDEQVKMWLNKIDEISVRDRNSSKIVEKLTGRKPQYHFDPVLTYDFLGKCEEIPKAVPELNYIILYGYSGRFTKEECRIIHDYSKKRKLKVLCIGGVQEYCDKFVNCNPFQVIAYFQHAECIITDTFHGTIFSVITHKQFVVFVRKQGYGNSEKLLDILGRLGLNDRIVNDPEKISECLENKIDYKLINEIIRKERKRSREYLQEQIRNKL